MNAEIIAREAFKEKAGQIVHGYAIAHAAAAFLLANTVVGDAPVLTVLTYGMIDSLGKLFGKRNTPFFILRKLSQLFAAQIGTYLAAKGVTWIPWFGNSINASLTFSITEIVGWTIFHIYDSGESLTSATVYDVRIASGKAASDVKSYDEFKAQIENLPEEVRRQYEALVRKLIDRELSEQEKVEVAKRIQELVSNASIARPG